MRRSSRYVGMFLAVVALVGTAGCRGLPELKTEIAELKNLNAKQASMIADKDDTVKKLNDSIRELQDQLAQEKRFSATTAAETKVAKQEAERLLDELKEFAGKHDGVAVRESEEGTVLIVEAEILFKSGRYEISDRGQAALKSIAGLLSARDEIVSIDGHSDSDPVKKSKAIGVLTNHHLAAMRAHSVFQALVASGVPDERVYLRSFGPNKPVGADKARNRRVEILLIPTSVAIQPAGSLKAGESKAASVKVEVLK